jgi:hypothetical protein
LRREIRESQLNTRVEAEQEDGINDLRNREVQTTTSQRTLLSSFYHMPTPKTVVSKPAVSSTDVASHGDERNRIEGLTRYKDQEVVSWETVLERFPEAFLPNASKLHDMAQSSATPSKPVLNMGLPNTGTLTMQAFLRCVPGYKPIHFVMLRNDVEWIGNCIHQAAWDPHYTVAEHGEGNGGAGDKSEATSLPSPSPPSVLLLDSCGYQNTDSITQMEYGGKWMPCSLPQHEHLERLVQENPLATLILPFRNFEAWIESSMIFTPEMLHYRDTTCPYFGMDGFDSSDQGHLKDDATLFIRQEIEQQKLVDEIMAKRNQENAQTYHDSTSMGNVLQELEKLRGKDIIARQAIFLVYHVTHVRNVVRRNPSVTLLEYSLKDADTGVLLPSIFQEQATDNTNVKTCSWGHSNANPSKN